MPKIIHLRVLTNEGTAVSDEAVSIQTPGDRGYMGVLFNHAALVTTVDPGKLKWITPDGRERVLNVGAGMLEVVNNSLTLLTDSAQKESSESS